MIEREVQATVFMISEEMQVDRSRFERDDAVQALPTSTGCSMQTECTTSASSTQTDSDSSRPHPGHKREISLCSTAPDETIKFEPAKKDADKAENKSPKGKHDVNKDPNEIFFHLVALPCLRAVDCPQH